MKKLSLLLLAIPVLIISACLKNENELHTGSYPEIADFISSKSPAPQFFMIDAASNSIIDGAKGTHLEFPGGSFTQTDGSYVNGEIQIELIEIFSNADMIYSGIFPVSNGAILNSGGEFFIGASQNGEELILAPGAAYLATFPAQAYDAAMGLFVGSQTDNGINWLFKPGYIADSMSYYDFMTYNELNDTYSVLCDTIGYENCDAFADMPVVNCKLKINGAIGLSNLNTVVFAILDDANSVVPLAYPEEANTCNFSDIGSTDMHILVTTVKFGYLYYGILAVHPEEGITYSIDIATTTEELLDAAILALP